ncbi:MAG: SUMF1/EgtB/PvdO family nonheme iron enzyme [Prochloraceae cyanobacterium]|nr:SUMF1/EgtB/PvdO family nonheme iron enzyme [Prochloraceae cyanobacterium]
MVKVALLVGVSEYQPGLQPLPSAIEDVKAMERVLKHPEMGGFDRVEVLSNPIVQDLRIAIYNLFADRSKEDLVLFYFSGHGVKDQNLNLYLTTPETVKSPKGLIVPPTAVKASYLQEQITNSRSKREVIILDCCYSGAIAKGMTAKDEGEVDIIAELGGKGRAILTSSTSVQYSFQQEAALSIYTQYLVEGIETGAADLDSDGKISADELHQYTKKKVQQASPAITPQFYPVEEGYNIYLVRSPVDDPKLKYRKEAQKLAKKGKFTPIGRRILNHLRIDLELTPEEANTIEVEILRPYQEYRQKLLEYEQAVKEAIEQEYRLSDYTRNELKYFQELLELRDEDVNPIEAELVPQQPQQQLEYLSESSPNTVELLSEQLLKEDVVRKNTKFDVVTVNASGKEVKRDKREAEYFTENLGNGVTLDMVAIPGGEFLMGTEDEEIERLVKKFYWDGFRREKPQHSVTVEPFFMGRFPVTQAQWKAIANLPLVDRDLESDPSIFKGDNRPVERVSWYDAVEFCKRLSRETGKEYRLPSEAEWEYACRAGTTTPFHFGETITSKLANYGGSETYASEPKGEYRQETTDVGKFPPNAFGLYDMHGNVCEWCADAWHDNYEGAPTDGSAWTKGGNDNRSPLRGGSWGVNPYCRSAYRIYNDIARRGLISNYYGFRVVCVGGRTK